LLLPLGAVVRFPPILLPSATVGKNRPTRRTQRASPHITNKRSIRGCKRPIRGVLIMNHRVVTAILLVVLAPLPVFAQVVSQDWKASGSKGAVAGGGKEAVAAGLAILQSGGNAADAAVATILALSVTDHGAFCFG